MLASLNSFKSSLPRRANVATGYAEVLLNDVKKYHGHESQLLGKNVNKFHENCVEGLMQNVSLTESSHILSTQCVLNQHGRIFCCHYITNHNLKCQSQLNLQNRYDIAQPCG